MTELDERRTRRQLRRSREQHYQALGRPLGNPTPTLAQCVVFALVCGILLVAIWRVIGVRG